MIKMLKTKIKKWLGIRQNDEDIDELFELYKNLVSIGVDVNFKSPHTIIIYSKLNGGMIQHIDVNFKDLKELQIFIEWLKRKYNTEKVWYDVPNDLRRYF